MDGEMFEALRKANADLIRDNAIAAGEISLVQDPVMSMATQPKTIAEDLRNPASHTEREVHSLLMFYFWRTDVGPYWAKEFAKFVPKLPVSKSNYKNYGARAQHRFPPMTVFKLLWSEFAEDFGDNPQGFHDGIWRSAKEHLLEGNRHGKVYLSLDNVQPNPAGWFKFAWDLHLQVAGILSERGGVKADDTLAIARSLLDTPAASSFTTAIIRNHYMNSEITDCGAVRLLSGLGMDEAQVCYLVSAWSRQPLSKVLEWAFQNAHVPKDVATKVPVHGPAYTGLFRFAKNYESMDTLADTRVVTDADIIEGGCVNPINLHAKHSVPMNQPWGQVYFDAAKFLTWVGEDCPLSDDEIFSLIWHKFGLQRIVPSRVKIKRHGHWNTRT